MCSEVHRNSEFMIKNLFQVKFWSIWGEFNRLESCELYSFSRLSSVQIINNRINEEKIYALGSIRKLSR